MKDNDDILKKFFEENRQDIADEGFSERVIQVLPRATNIWPRVLKALAIAAVILLICTGKMPVVADSLADVYVSIVLKIQDILAGMASQLSGMSPMLTLKIIVLAAGAIAVLFFKGISRELNS